jgi:putative transposase
MSSELTQPRDVGLWRFGIISPLLHRNEDDEPLRVQIEQLAHRVFYTPAGTEKQFCPGTIRDWLCRYRTCGIDGLRNKVRKNRGGSLVPHALQQALVELRKTQPKWTVKRLLKNIRDQGLWDGRKPSKSAMYRFTAAHGLNRSTVQPAQPVRSFQFPYFGDL